MMMDFYMLSMHHKRCLVDCFIIPLAFIANHIMIYVYIEFVALGAQTIKLTNFSFKHLHFVKENQNI